jgi:hypothetical protein
MPSNATKSTVLEFVSRRRLCGRNSGIFVVAATRSYRLGLSTGDYFFMTNNSYTAGRRIYVVARFSLVRDADDRRVSCSPSQNLFRLIGSRFGKLGYNERHWRKRCDQL